MGYIRTKNKRTNEENIYPSDVDKNFLDFVGDEILAQADTIKELCDRFVLVVVSKGRKSHSAFKRLPNRTIGYQYALKVYQKTKVERECYL